MTLGVVTIAVVLGEPRHYTSSVLPNLIVPTLTRYDLLVRLLDSIDYPVEHLLIIDNGGQNPDFIRKPAAVRKFTWLTMPANLGVSGAWNLGIKSFPFADRWFICSDDVEFAPGTLLEWSRVAKHDALTIVSEWPHYQFFTVGDDVVDRVGLFDEAIFPANFEDDDYQWRCEAAGVPVRMFDLPHTHVRQGTVFSGGNAQQNARTYPENEIYFRAKQSREDYSAGHWSLSRRRRLHWETPSG